MESGRWRLWDHGGTVVGIVDYPRFLVVIGGLAYEAGFPADTGNLGFISFAMVSPQRSPNEKHLLPCAKF